MSERIIKIIVKNRGGFLVLTDDISSKERNEGREIFKKNIYITLYLRIGCDAVICENEILASREQLVPVARERSENRR